MPKWVDYSRYDFKFCINGNNYIIEVDGGWHFIGNYMSGKTAEETTQKDKLKEVVAMQNGCIVIRIDYNYSGNNKYDYIVNSTINSKLADILDLSKVDFSEIHKRARSSLLMKIVYAWNNYKEKSIYQIKKDFNIKSYVARESLYYASNLGLINESIEDIIKLNRLHACKMEGKLPQKVMCNETGEIFESMQAASNKYHGNLSNYFRFNLKTSGHLPDGTRLTWIKIND